MKNSIISVCILGLTLALGNAWAGDEGAPEQKRELHKKRHRVRTLEDDDFYPENFSSARISSHSTEVSHVKLRPSLSYSFIRPKALNNDLATFAQANGINSSYKLDGAPTVSLSAEYEVVPQLLFGLRMDWFTTSTNTVQVRNGDVMANFQTSLSGLPLYATVTFDQPIAPHWSFGLSGGVGAPILYQGTVEVSGSNIAGTPNGAATFGATPLTGFGLAYFNYELGRKVAFRTETGYRLLSSSQMILAENYGASKAGTVYTDANNSNVTVDASALFIGASAVISL